MIMAASEVAAYAAQWGSYITAGDPGACLYGFSDDGKVQSERHRADCIAQMTANRATVAANPDDYDDNELEQIDAFLSYLATAESSAELESHGVDVWACNTIYVEADSEEHAAKLVAERYAGTRLDPDTYDHMDSNDMLLEGDDFQSSACTYYGLERDSVLVPVDVLAAVKIDLGRIVQAYDDWQEEAGDDVNDERWKDGHGEGLCEAANVARATLAMLEAAKL